MLNALEKQLKFCRTKDFYSLSRRIKSLKKSKSSDGLRKLSDDLERSINHCEARKRNIPKKINYPSTLPISRKSSDIKSLIIAHQVIVVTGGTGSGKTTQLPKICLDAGLGIRGLIAHTQPRRLAATSVANRIAAELNSEVGDLIGFQIRFNDRIKESTCIKLMTDGILLAEIQNDEYLSCYDTIIIDEAHERSLNIDFLLGFLKNLLKKRKDLKLIITSATIDVEKFSAHFDDAPIISVEGQAYPVKTVYAPVVEDEEKGVSVLDGIVNNLKLICERDRKAKKISGDILVFLSSEREIREAAQAIRKERVNDTEVLPLYARLRHSEQTKIFKSHSGRRVVLSTNVAETSLTVPGIKYVIDSGLARISRYSILSKVQRLPIEKISQASANQRKGRCGRLENGICIRLYSENDFNARPVFTDPEIKRTNLAAVILRMLSLRLGNVEAFPFLEHPSPKTVNEGFKLLFELNALNNARKLTVIGKQMAALPVDPKMGRMLVAANELFCLKEILIIVSMLSIQDPRERNNERKETLLENPESKNNEASDFMCFIDLWENYETMRRSSTQSQLKKYCKENNLSFLRMREWREIHKQLALGCRKLGFKINKNNGTYSAIHKSVIAGSLNQIATKAEGKQYIGSRNKRFVLSKSSVISKSNHKWIVSGELIETSQIFSSIAAKIKPEWIVVMAPHLVKKEIFGPHWSKKSQSVQAFQKVRLYGLVIIEKALIDFSSVNPTEAHKIFISEGLVAGDLRIKANFFVRNKQFLRELEKEEEKLRRPQLIVNENEITRFYEDRIPAHINSTADLASWLKSASKNDQASLIMSYENLITNDFSKLSYKNYPDSTLIDRNKLAIDYIFDPDSIRDGATVDVPIKIINQIKQKDIDWSVPGIIREKCIFLLKGLPKSVRKKIIPISGFVDEILPEMSSLGGDIVDNLSRQLISKKRIQAKRDDFLNIELPSYLVIKVRVKNNSGKELCAGDNLDELKIKCQELDKKLLIGEVEESKSHSIERSNLIDWDFDELPEKTEIGEKLVVIRYPALVDNESSVAVELFSDQREAQDKNRLGLIRLYMFKTVQQRNLLKKRFNRLLKEYALYIPNHLEDLVGQAIRAAYSSSFNTARKTPRTKEEFLGLLNSGKSKLYSSGEDIADIFTEILRRRFHIIKELSKLTDSRFNYLKIDIEGQLKNLITHRVLSDNSIETLKEFPRYMKAIELRLGKYPHFSKKDEEYSGKIASYWSQYCDLTKEENQNKFEDIDSLRWMLEEYRVSLFAQSLGTKFPVSAKRIDRHLKHLMN